MWWQATVRAAFVWDSAFQWKFYGKLPYQSLLESELTVIMVFIFIEAIFNVFFLLLQIRPFMKAHLNREKDKELFKLSQYLKEIAKLEDFSFLNHKHWER